MTVDDKKSVNHKLIKVPGRVVLYAKDIENITGRNIRTARRIIAQIRKALGKTNVQFITIGDFCQYTGMDEELVREFLFD